VLAVIATERHDPVTALWWMAYTIAVDSIDGTLARAVGVKQVLPFFDGTRLDDIVDYFTWVVVPAFFVLHMELLPPAVATPVALCPVLASCYGFCRTDAKTSDHFFTGFPSYWNIVAYYMYALGTSPATNAVILVGLSVAVFVPIRYVYPSRTTTLRGLTVTFGILWAAAMLWLLTHAGDVPRGWVMASLAFPVYYFALSFVLHVRRAAHPLA
jgi:phosphatidylcholine synthase